ncbi:MAG: precorrin-6A reductase [Euryarchaeota archaeon]|nr:precorrin-6A reductase [Euryarchaeota archaeon]
MNIMVMAGTSDSSRIIKILKQSKKFNIIATTTTPHGAEIAKSAGADDFIFGGLEKDEINQVIKKKEIDILVDATHPFAIDATKNAIRSARETGIKYIRFERSKMDVPESDFIHIVYSFEEAANKTLDLVKETDKRILHLAGVSSLKYITEKIDSSRIFARVLPSPDSLKKCLDAGLKQDNIIAMQGTFSKNFNKSLMNEYNISIIITKESGKTGGSSSKINAALELGLNVVLIMRPEVLELENEKIFMDLDSLNNYFLDIYP